jgi:C-terminal processing protease CtpA/Prc
MHSVTRRTVLAGASAAAATTLAPMLGVQHALANPDCLQTLNEFMVDASKQQLNGQQRELIVKQAIKLLQEFYVHLPSKRERYDARPLERLQDLQQKALQFKSDVPFHAEMMAIFTELRDMHTRYCPPAPYANAHAFLPFKVEACFEDGRRKYIVSRVVDGFVNATFRRGVEILSWNGVPIEQAAERAGGEGAAPSAKLAVGLARLTYRAMEVHSAPEGDTVLVHYRAGDKELDVEVPWQVMKIARDEGACDASCNEIQQIQEFRKFLFAPYDLCRSFGKSERFATPDGEFGYIRIYSFDKRLLADGDDEFVDTFRKQVASFADTRGLIVDVRDNGGGSTRAGERIVQWIAPAGPIEPSPLYFRATKTTLEFCKLGDTVGDLGPDGLRPWIPSIERALQTGATFSDAFEYSRKEDCNAADRVVFPRPVIVVTSGLTYSAAEMFAAGFQDHGGLILGVDETTGGGGAGFRKLFELSDYFTGANQQPPFEDLPNDAGFQVAYRRAKRVNLGTGKEIEDAGVRRDRAHDITRNDLLNDNADLKAKAAKLLMEMK